MACGDIAEKPLVGSTYCYTCEYAFSISLSTEYHGQLPPKLPESFFHIVLDQPTVDMGLQYWLRNSVTELITQLPDGAEA